ncbi:DUF2946 family protein [Desertibaculum subflavum]|uniref:DUF2946 family protein n=1 Tax=Desertibaculum subflavum TaxID=2268458 RepID=UPI000E66F992
MRRPVRPFATWLAVFALAAQTVAFALHGPLRVLAGADGGLVICTAEGLKRIGPGQSEKPARGADHACTACVTLAATAIPPAMPPAAAIAYVPLDTGTGAFRPAAPRRPASGPAQPRAPPLPV